MEFIKAIDFIKVMEFIIIIIRSSYIMIINLLNVNYS